jgi:16S rRNA (guanine(527)-N(7))-methyltransferase RsmG
VKHLEDLILLRLQEVKCHLPSSFSPPPTPEVCAKLAEYLALLQRWNAKIDLVAPASDEVQVERHILDSVAAYWMVLNVIEQRELGICLDIGSGAGLPGLIFAVCDPLSQIVLCEPREKRVVFLREAVRLLGLSNVSILPVRSEAIALNDLPGPAGVVVARALGNDAALVSVCEKVVAPGGFLAQLVGPSYRGSQSDMKLLPYSISAQGPSRSLAVLWFN